MVSFLHKLLTKSLYFLRPLIHCRLPITMSMRKLEVKEGSSLPYPKWGLLLSDIAKFIESKGGRGEITGLTTTEICDKFIKPLTLKGKQSYCEYLLENGKKVERATVFVSHAWRYEFIQVYDSLCHHLKDEPETVIYFDLFSNNQHLAVDLDFHWWSTTFREAIESFGRVVLILLPYGEPIVFTRAWCLFEIYTAIATGSLMEVALSPHEREEFLNAIINDFGTYMKLLADIDVRNAEAWNPEDKRKIFQVVEKLEGGFDGVNGMICDKMREWMITTLEKATEEDGLDTEEVIRRKNAYCDGLSNQGRFEEAMVVISCCEEQLENIDDDELKAVVYRQKANVYTDQGKYNEALEYYEKCLVIYLEKLGDKHPDVATTYNNMAMVYDDQGKTELANKYKKKALEITDL